MAKTEREFMAPGDLLNTVKRTWSDGDYGRVLDIVTAEWPAVSSRSKIPQDAETCRLAMISAASLKRYTESVLWQARALTRFVVLDWREGAAAVIMSNTYRLLAMANDDYVKGVTFDVLQPAPEAALVLADLIPIAEGPGRGFDFGPNPELVARFVYEKSGFLLTIERRWEEAAAAYDRALDYVTHEPRGQVKVPLGRAVVTYLSERDAGRDGLDAAAVTERLAADPRTLAHRDLSELATTNLDRMRQGRLDLVPYEIL